MFAVKGWSVDAKSLKPQTEVYKPSKSQDGDQLKAGKKRKRGHVTEAKQDPNVRPDDVGRLWEQHVEGKGLSKAQKSRVRKKQKLEQPEVQHESPEATEKSPDATEKTTSVKKAEKSQDTVSDTPVEKHGRSKKSKDEKRVQRVQSPEHAATEITTTPALQQAAVPNVPPVTKDMKLTPMQSAMRQKLVSARFRHLNQTLYTEPSAKAQDLFSQNPSMFEDYHAGFRQQVSVWPENPLDRFILEIRRRGKLKPPKVFKDRNGKRVTSQAKDPGLALPKTDGHCSIADLGCGDARLAHTLKTSGDTTSLHLKLLSYDLHSPSSLVTKADISNLPLADNSVNVAIFCLALMGTNWISFIEEAYRVLQWKGELWVAEIKSRFGRVGKAGKPVEHSVGGKRKQAVIKKAQDAKQREQVEVNEQEVLQTEVDGVVNPTEETDVSAFVDVLKRRGFVLKPPEDKAVDLKNRMFVKMEFVKALTPTKGKGVPKDDGKGVAKAKTKFIPDVDEVATEDEATVLKPCLYKIR